MRTLSSTTVDGTTLGPDYTRARPGHRAVSIRMDCVLVYYSFCEVSEMSAKL